MKDDMKEPIERTFYVTKLAKGPMREQIAGMIIHWTQLELTIERVISNLQGKKGKVEIGKKIGRQLKKLEGLAGAKLPADQAADIQSHIDEIKQLVNLRNRVVHGLWGLDENGKLYSLYYHDSNNEQLREMNHGDVRQIKLRTWKKIKYLRNYEEIDVPKKKPAEAG
jgi:hypothetical protein